MPQLPVTDARNLAHLLADQDRLKVLGAVALGAGSDDDIAGVTGLSAKAATTARKRLQDAWLLAEGEDGLVVRYDRIDNMVRPPGPPPTPEEQELAPFVRGNKLTALPAKPSRRLRILEHVVETSFAPEQEYDEKTVNRLLAQWCEGGEVDHVTVRRYLIDAHLLTRDSGTYRRPAA